MGLIFPSVEMSSDPIVEPLNAIVHIRVRFRPGVIITVAYPSRLERMKETLHHCVVPTVTLTTHRRTGTSLFKHRLIVTTRVNIALAAPTLDGDTLS